MRPGRIGSLDLPNRIIMGSMHMGIETQPGGEELAAFYAERARGGAALIVTGGSAVSRVAAGGRHYSFVNEDVEAPKLRRIAQAVHDAGGRIALQLFHAGRYGSHEFFGLQPLAPSAVTSRVTKSPPRAMNDDDLAQTRSDFVDGALRARELGYDAVEIMGSEGYLLNQFLSPITNLRDDAWGGDFERRARFPLEVLRAMRAAVGAAFPIIYRMSGADLMPQSTTDDETRAFARMLADAGADALNVGVGWHESSIPTVQFLVKPGAWVECAHAIKTAVGALPVIASNRINRNELAERVLAEGRVDFVSMARPFLADPAIVEKSRSGRSDAVNICIACNQACIDRSLFDGTVSCMVNPRAGNELTLREDAPAASPRRFAVVGGGPAGLEAARVLAARGHRVVLYEAGRALGGQFRLAAQVPGKADFGSTIDYFRAELARLGVDVRLERHITTDEALAELGGYAGIVLATGVVPRTVDLPGADLPHVLTYPQALLDGAPGSGPIAVVGAGGIGVDVAHLFSHAGRAVTIMRRGDVVGQYIGRSTRWAVLRELRERKVQILTKISYERIVPEGIWVRDEGGTRLIEAQTVVVAAGQLRNDALRETLERAGLAYRVVGGALEPGELDAVRAFREGALAAHAFADGEATATV
jgi:2,4-dienoyl-CoA reductase (NADPH2)